jgi:hypothetical protein
MGFVAKLSGQTIMKKTIILILSFTLLLPVFVSAGIGVGVGTGKIQVDEPIKPGVIKLLPPLTVINTGDEPSEYGVSIEYLFSQPELKPQREWFSFEPSGFNLEPGKVQVVQIKLTLPIKGVKPGNYFAYLEAHPVKKAVSGQTSIGAAAAAKLYFTIAPANFLQGIYYRLMASIALFAPQSYVVLAVIAAACLVVLFRRYFSFNIGINLKKKQSEKKL